MLYFMINKFYFGLKRISTYRLSKATPTFHVCIVYIITTTKWPQNQKKNLTQSHQLSPKLTLVFTWPASWGSRTLRSLVAFIRWWGPEAGNTVVLKNERRKCMDAFGQGIGHSDIKPSWNWREFIAWEFIQHHRAV